MKITRQSTARKLQAYLKGRLTQTALVDWAEQAMMKGDFAPADAAVLRKVVPRIGVADVRGFGWDDGAQSAEMDRAKGAGPKRKRRVVLRVPNGQQIAQCARLLRLLGFRARIEVVAA
ncbi:MAG: hypothetical protein WC869_14530 [Phycisphaerae bacterium]